MDYINPQGEGPLSLKINCDFSLWTARQGSVNERYYPCPIHFLPILFRHAVPQWTLQWPGPTLCRVVPAPRGLYRDKIFQTSAAGHWPGCQCLYPESQMSMYLVQ